MPLINWQITTLQTKIKDKQCGQNECEVEIITVNYYFLFREPPFGPLDFQTLLVLGPLQKPLLPLTFCSNVPLEYGGMRGQRKNRPAI